MRDSYIKYMTARARSFDSYNKLKRDGKQKYFTAEINTSGAEYVYFIYIYNRPSKYVTECAYFIQI